MVPYTIGIQLLIVALYVPPGWHVPSGIVSGPTLENFLITNGYNYDGSAVGNKIAKALASSSGWNVSSTEGSVGNTDYSAKRNSTGFTALPGDCRDANQLIFGSIGNYGMWWTASEDSPSTAWDRGSCKQLQAAWADFNVNKSSWFLNQMF